MSGKVKRIKNLLTQMLRDGPCREREVWESIRGAGYSFHSYHRARRALRVQTTRFGWGENGYWEINLPGRSTRRIPVVQSSENKQSA